jgi:cation:H+ antiporter
MFIILFLVLMAFGTILLLSGADWFLDSIRDMSRLSGLSALVLGIILVGLEPEEMLVSALASWRGNTDLALSNVLGTNITVVTCALGIAAIITPLSVPRILRRQALLATVVSLVPLIMLLFGNVSRWEGLLLLVLFAIYTFVLVRMDRNVLQQAVEEDDDDDDDDSKEEEEDEDGDTKSAGKLIRLAGLVLVGLLAMAGGGYLLVVSAEGLVAQTGLKDSVVGLTLVSLATSSEMIALAFKAARKDISGVLVGGIIGSFAYNLLVTMGLAALIHPLPVDLRLYLVPLVALVVSHVALLVLIWLGRVGRVAGGILLLSYVIFVVLIFVMHIKMLN